MLRPFLWLLFVYWVFCSYLVGEGIASRSNACPGEHNTSMETAAKETLGLMLAAPSLIGYIVQVRDHSIRCGDVR